MLFRWLVSVALFAATGAFTVSTSNKDVQVKENEGVDLTCSHSADFGQSARLEWKFKDPKGSQSYVVFNGKPTTPYQSRVSMYSGNLRFSKVTRKDNGIYTCEVSGNGQFAEVDMKLTVLVPPSVPLCRIPTSVTTGKKAVLSCHDADGSPPPQYRWYKGGVLLPPDPSKIAAFRNATYKMTDNGGKLEFPAVTRMDTGEYYCEAYNSAGPAQRCKTVKMEVRDVNTGGIVAGVIVALLLLLLLGVGIWYANKKGYLPSNKPKSNVVYQPPSVYGGEEDDGDFKQKSSFVV
ncbi:F11 receptor, tandem duplicate 1 [Synchiropus picturatus]